ncbi:hypothetical protein SAMN05443377_1188 [Propionibacterium cyclohexanicum]|uniref:Nucleotide-diphospho-sugar transferase n=1 Tax=Propionibacterium cyclohexanicum TaxID=64702 RepID=A0A1H9T209_9ACTN|nr:DUF6492 family protein [Propionibacterium cyclohexanicum]SER91290.1 hypothetical protein SAMN05443377_1188 [Propionibacterium cyclohexanicum]
MSLAIVTPSYRPDLQRFGRLHRSVLRHTGPDVHHFVLVPGPDVRHFRALESRRLTVLCQTDVIPGHFFSTAWFSRIPHLPRGYRITSVNLARPWPPIRGWIQQQLVKIAFVAALETDVALMVDSDVVLVRSVEEATFRRAEQVRHYRLPHGVSPAMHRHLGWRTTSARLLGLGAPSPDFADYNAGLISWSPRLVRALIDRIEQQNDGPWARVLGSQLDLSEYFLYGEYLASQLVGEEHYYCSTRSLCHSYWNELTPGSVKSFVGSLAADDVALLVQSNSGTSEAVLDQLIETLERP